MWALESHGRDGCHAPGVPWSSEHGVSWRNCQTPSSGTGSKEKITSNLLLFPKWKAGELCPEGFAAISLKGWKLHQVWEGAHSYTQHLGCKIQALFIPGRAGLAAPHSGLQDCASALFHTQQSQHPSLSISHSDAAPQFLLELFFFFFHSPWGKKQSWNGKFQLQQILNVAKSQAHGNRTQKRGCWTSLTPHSTSGSTSKAYFDPLWNKTQFHKQELCKPLCIYYLQKPQPFNGSTLLPIWIQLQNRHPKSLGEPEEKEMGKPRLLWAQSNFTSFGWAPPTHLIADRLFKMSLLQAAALKFLYPLKSGPLSHPHSSTDQNLWPGQKAHIFKPACSEQKVTLSYKDVINICLKKQRSWWSWAMPWDCTAPLFGRLINLAIKAVNWLFKLHHLLVWLGLFFHARCTFNRVIQTLQLLNKLF